MMDIDNICTNHMIIALMVSHNSFFGRGHVIGDTILHIMQKSRQLVASASRLSRRAFVHRRPIQGLSGTNEKTVAWHLLNSRLKRSNWTKSTNYNKLYTSANYIELQGLVMSCSVQKPRITQNSTSQLHLQVILEMVDCDRVVAAGCLHSLRSQVISWSACFTQKICRLMSRARSRPNLTKQLMKLIHRFIACKATSNSLREKKHEENLFKLCSVWQWEL